MMIPHHSPAGRWLIVTVREDAKQFYIEDKRRLVSVIPDKINFSDRHKYNNLPPGNYSIVGLASELSEEQKKEIVEFIETEYYRNYLYEYGATTSITTSFDSLLKHHNLDPKTTLIIRQINE